MTLVQHPDVKSLNRVHLKGCPQGFCALQMFRVLRHSSEHRGRVLGWMVEDNVACCLLSWGFLFLLF